MEDGLTVYMTESEVRSVVERIFEDHGSQAEFAARESVSKSLISQFLHRKTGLSESLARKLGFKRVVRYIPIENQGLNR